VLTESLNVCRNVQRILAAREWSREYLAYRAHLSRKTINRVLDQPIGYPGPDLGTQLRLADALGISRFTLSEDPPVQSPIRNPQSPITNPALLRIRASKTGFIAGLIRLFTND